MAAMKILTRFGGVKNIIESGRSTFFLIPKRHKFRVEDQFKKATADILNENTDILMIDSYNPLGFKLNNGMNVIGPAVFFPRTVLHWNVASADDINEDSLSLFTLLEPKIDILVIGKGDKSSEVSPMVRKYLSMKHIKLELLPTDQAIALHNYLVSERRLVAGAFIPPSTYQVTDSIVKDHDITDVTGELRRSPENEIHKLLSKEEIRESVKRMYGSSEAIRRDKLKESTARYLEEGTGDEGKDDAGLNDSTDSKNDKTR